MSRCMISSAGRADRHHCHSVETALRSRAHPRTPKGTSGHVLGKRDSSFQCAETFVSQRTGSCVLGDSSIFKMWCVSEAQRGGGQAGGGTDRRVGRRAQGLEGGSEDKLPARSTQGAHSLRPCSGSGLGAPRASAVRADTFRSARSPGRCCGSTPSIHACGNLQSSVPCTGLLPA